MSLVADSIFKFPFLFTIVFLFPYLFAGNLAEKLFVEPEVRIIILKFPYYYYLSY